MSLKVYTILLLLLVLAPQILAQPTPPDDRCNYNDTSLPNINYFANYYQTEPSGAISTTQFVNPAPLDTVSLNECFSVHSQFDKKSCCAPGLLESRFQSKLFGLNTVWNDYINSIVNLRNTIPTILDLVSNSETLNSFVANIPKASIGDLTPSDAAGILSEIYTLENDIKRFRIEGKKCFNALLQFRGLSFCYGCSAGGYFKIFKYQSQRPPATEPLVAAMNEASCSQLILQCGPAWNFILKTQAMMFLTYYISNLDKIAKPPVGFTPATFPDLFFFYYSYNPTTTPNLTKVTPTFSEVYKSLKACPAGTKSADSGCGSEQLSKICSSLFNFANLDKLPKLLPEVKKITTTTRLLAQDIEESPISQDMAEESLAAGESRILQGGVLTTQSVYGSIIVVPEGEDAIKADQQLGAKVPEYKETVDFNTAGGIRSGLIKSFSFMLILLVFCFLLVIA